MSKKLIPKGQLGLITKLIEKFPKTAEELTKLVEELKKIKPSEWDAAYNAAVKSGDMDKAQKLIGKRFMIKAPNTKISNIQYHGNRTDTPIKFFDKSKIGTLHKDLGLDGFWFVDDPEIAKWEYSVKPESWGKKPEFGEVIPAYLNLENPEFLTQKGLRIEESPYGPLPLADETLLELADRAKKLDNPDGYVFKLIDNADVDPFYRSIQNQIVVRNPKNIKSATVTYDDQKNIIPLSLRFNFNINDIRYGYPSSQLTGTTTEEIQNFIDNDIIPRVQAQGHQITEYKPNIRVADFKNDLFDQKLKNEDVGAWFSLATNEITLRSPLKNLDFGLVAHETGGHGLRYNMLTDYSPVPRRYIIEYLKNPNNPEVQEILSNANIGNEVFNDYELKLLNEGYPEISNYFNNFVNPLTGLKLSEVQKLERIQVEQGAINTQFRAELSEHGKLTGVLLDKKIDKIPEGEILRMKIEHSYTQNGTIDIVSKITGVNPDKLMFYSPESLLELVNKFPELKSIVNKTKQAMKTVGIYVVPIGLGIGVAQKENKNNKLIPKTK